MTQPCETNFTGDPLKDLKLKLKVPGLSRTQDLLAAFEA